MTFLYALPVLLALVMAGALSFNLLRLFLALPVALLRTQLRMTDHEAERVTDSLAAGVLAAGVFAMQLYQPPPS